MAQPQNEQKKPTAPKTNRRKLDIWNKLAVSILSIFLVGCISVFFVLVNIINDPDGMRFSQDGLTTLSNSRYMTLQEIYSMNSVMKSVKTLHIHRFHNR